MYLLSMPYPTLFPLARTGMFGDAVQLFSDLGAQLIDVQQKAVYWLEVRRSCARTDHDAPSLVRD